MENKGETNIPKGTTVIESRSVKYLLTKLRDQSTKGKVGTFPDFKKQPKKWLLDKLYQSYTVKYLNFRAKNQFENITFSSNGQKF